MSKEIEDILDYFKKYSTARDVLMLNKVEEYIKDKSVEIRELKNTISQAREYLKKYACYDEDMQEFCRDLIYDECLELLNILDTEIEIPLDENGCNSLVKINGKWYEKKYKIPFKIEEGEDK